MAIVLTAIVGIATNIIIGIGCSIVIGVVSIAAFVFLVNREIIHEVEI